jgi:hypothetical protein
MAARARSHYRRVAGDVDQKVCARAETGNHIEAEVHPCQVCLNIDEEDREAPEDVNGVSAHLDFRRTERVEICQRVVTDVGVEVRVPTRKTDRIFTDKPLERGMVVPRPIMV